MPLSESPCFPDDEMSDDFRVPNIVNVQIW